MNSASFYLMDTPMNEPVMEYRIKENEGYLILTLKLVGGKTRIFIGEKEIWRELAK